jgi:hypothetical protein
MRAPLDLSIENQLASGRDHPWEEDDTDDDTSSTDRTAPGTFVGMDNEEQMIEVVEEV